MNALTALWPRALEAGEPDDTLPAQVGRAKGLHNAELLAFDPPQTRHESSTRALH